jgi:hypothetical protein
MRRLGTALRLAIGISLIAFVAACNEDGTFLPSVPEPDSGGGGGEIPEIPVTNYISDAEIGETDGTYVHDTHPVGTAAAPVVLGTTQFIQGASLVMEVTVDDTATELYVGSSNANIGYFHFDLTTLPRLEESAGAAVPMGRSYQEKLQSAGVEGNGAWIARSASAATSYVVGVLPVATSRGFTILITSSDGTNVSASRRHIVQVNTTAAGSDRLQASLNWSHPVDMDLHLVTPSGAEIYFGNRADATGGALDLDSNAACGIDGINNENISWAQSEPPAGEYVVYVNLWSRCDVDQVMPFVLTVLVNGTPQTFFGEFTPAQDSDPPREITRVTLN